MKLPSLVKLPQHKKFHIEPRYYDSVKEDIESRVSKIKKELNLSDETGNALPSTSLSGAFERRRTQTRQSNILQMVIFLILAFSATGYLFFGNNVLYVFLILMPGYFYFRIRKKSKEGKS